MSARSEDVTDVDSIWAEMLAENKPARNTRSVSLVNFDAAIGTKKTTKKAKQFKLQGGYGSVGGSVELGDDKPAGGKKREQKAAVSGTAKQDATGQKERKPVLGSGGIASLMATTKSAIGAKKARETDFAWLQNYGVAATGSEDSSVKQGLEPQFEPIAENVPTDSADAFIAHLQRDINCLDSGNEVELKVRLRAVKKLELIFVKNHAELPSNILDVALEELTKPLLKRLQRDGSEKIREIATSVLRTLLEHAPKIDHSSLQFIVPILVSRLGSEDLDGVAHLPPVMRPNPEQRPVEIQKPVEESEEVRKQLALLIQAFATRISTQQVLGFIDELTGLLRALLMDSYAGVKMLGCETMTTFCYNHKDVLLHFTEPMGRSITSCLVHNHFRLRVAALQTLTAVLHCGTWKHNHEVVQHLVAWQDPNQVPIKSFYESHTTVNYFSSLTFDRHPAVRRFWFETLAFWLLRLPDHVDHEPHIFPYILSGLYDENEDIALETFWLLEACGAQYEIDNEKDLREKKQYGLDAEWTYKGKVIVPFPLQGRWRREIRKRTQPQGPDFQGVRAKQTRAIDLDEEDGTSPDKEDLVQLPQRDYSWSFLDCLYVSKRLPRPRLGARMWVRTHIRRFIKALFNNVLDFRECNMLNASRLLTMCVAYAEDNITEWLSSISEALIKFYSGKAYLSGSAELAESYDLIGKLIGSYVEPDTVWIQYEDSFDVRTVWYLEQRLAVFHLLTCMLDGAFTSLEAVWDKDARERGDKQIQDLGLLDRMLPQLIEKLSTCDLVQDPCGSEGLPVADTLWNLVAMVARGSAALSWDWRCKVLVVAVALIAGVTGQEEQSFDENESSSRATVVEEVAALPGAAFFGAISMPLTLQAKKSGASTDVVAKQAKTAASEDVAEAICSSIAASTADNKDPSSTSGSSSSCSLSPMQKFSALSKRLGVRVEDVASNLVDFTRESFPSFEAFCKLLPVQKLVDFSGIWDGLHAFSSPTEEPHTRLAALRLCVLLLHREDHFYQTVVREQVARWKKSLDMDDIDCDDDVSAAQQFEGYEKRRKHFIARLLDCFTPVLVQATRSPPEAPRRRPKDLNDLRKMQGGAGADESKELLSDESNTVEDVKDKAEVETAASPKKAFDMDDIDDDDDIVVEEVTGSGLGAVEGDSSTSQRDQQAALADASEENNKSCTREDSSAISSPALATTPYFIVVQALAVLRDLIVPKFQGIEILGQGVWHMSGSDLLSYVPEALFSALSSLVTDVEHYKRVSRSLEQQERIALKKSADDDISAVKMKEIRETSVEKSVQARLSAAELLFLLLRSRFNTNCVATVVNKKKTVVKNAQRTTISPSDAGDYEYLKSGHTPKEGSISKGDEILIVSATKDHPLWDLRSIFRQLRGLLKGKYTPTLEPMFVRPTAPQIFLFASEMMRMFLQAPARGAKHGVRAQLYDDAARQMLTLETPTFDDLERRIIEAEDFFQITTDVVLQLMGLNLSLPPVPNSPLTPLVSSANQGSSVATIQQQQAAKRATESIEYGMEESVLGDGQMSMEPVPVGWLTDYEKRMAKENAVHARTKSASSSFSTKGNKSSDCCSEPVTLIMLQSEDCLRWNAGLSLYKLISELTKIDPTHLLTAAHRWENEGKQGRIGLVKHLITSLDLMSMK